MKPSFLLVGLYASLVSTSPTTTSAPDIRQVKRQLDLFGILASMLNLSIPSTASTTSKTSTSSTTSKTSTPSATSKTSTSSTTSKTSTSSSIRASSTSSLTSSSSLSGTRTSSFSVTSSSKSITSSPNVQPSSGTFAPSSTTASIIRTSSAGTTSLSAFRSTSSIVLVSSSATAVFPSSSVITFSSYSAIISTSTAGTPTAVTLVSGSAVRISTSVAVVFSSSITSPASSSARSIPSQTSTVMSSSVSSAQVAQSSSMALSISSTILVMARDATSARQATSGLNGYGIPFQILLVPSSGIDLPILNTSTVGNFGGIMILSGLSYEYASGWRSALTNQQYSQLYNYQTAFGIRMVQYDVYPSADFGTTAIAACCDNGEEQLVYYSNTSAFTQAGLNIGAGMSTVGLYHYVSSITDPSTTIEVAQFAANSVYSSPSTAGVINNFQGREQMAFFTTWATDWSPTSNYLQHGAITWMTRGLYAGYRRVNLNAQIDDMMLKTPIYNGNGTGYRVTPNDMSTIRDWVPKINAKLNPGSFFYPEIGYNGDGTFVAVDPASLNDDCEPHPIYTGLSDTDAEFRKPLGSGVDMWPANAPSNYSYSLTCITQDPLTSWFMTPANRDQFTHISHTFTHEHLNNATYHDVYREISFNQAWLAQTGISSGSFSTAGLIPPAITGLHNGDALSAFWQLGLRNVVGDNARPALRNTQNQMWPYITNSGTDGFDGMTILPRWPLRIYWNCDTPACTLAEWIDTGNGSGDFEYLMMQEKKDMMRYYFGGYRDGVMFHQANLRNTGVAGISTADGTVVNSLYQAWVEEIVQEFNRLANWPIISLKQDDLANAFTSRMTRDACGYTITMNLRARAITSVTVAANGNTCSAEIPVTVPGSVSNTQGFRTEKVGNDPLTVWVKLSGSPVTLTLSSPLTL